jgi:hypothetical protein
MSEQPLQQPLRLLRRRHPRVPRHRRHRESRRRKRRAERPRLRAPLIVRNRVRSIRELPLAIRPHRRTPTLDAIVVVSRLTGLERTAKVTKATFGVIAHLRCERGNLLSVLCNALPRSIVAVASRHRQPIRCGERCGYGAPANDGSETAQRDAKSRTMRKHGADQNEIRESQTLATEFILVSPSLLPIRIRIKPVVGTVRSSDLSERRA